MKILYALVALVLLPSCQSTAPSSSSSYRPDYRAEKVCVDGQKRPVQAKDPQWIVRIEPRYPADAAKNKVQGHIKLQFVITTQGTVSNIQVMESVPAGVFDAEAVRALQRWKYTPGCIDGQLADFPLTETLTFMLDPNTP